MLDGWQDDPTSTHGWCRSTRCRQPPSAIAARGQVPSHGRHPALLLAAARSGAAARRRRPRLLRVVLVVPARAAAGDRDREAARTAGHPELSQRRSAGSSPPVRARAPRDAALGRSERRASPSCARFSARSAFRREVVPNTIDLRRVRLPGARSAAAAAPVDAQLRAALQRGLRAPRVRADPGALPRGDADARRHAARRTPRSARSPRSSGCGTSPSPAVSRPSEIHRYYADADIYVQTPSIDNMPLSVLEAFASGLPVVSTNVGGVPTILTDGVHGLLAPDDDDEALAAQVMTLLESPVYARQLAAAARQSCAAYEWPVARDGWLAAYRRPWATFDSVQGPTCRSARPTLIGPLANRYEDNLSSLGCAGCHRDEVAWRARPAARIAAQRFDVRVRPPRWDRDESARRCRRRRAECARSGAAIRRGDWHAVTTNSGAAHSAARRARFVLDPASAAGTARRRSARAGRRPG